MTEEIVFYAHPMSRARTVRWMLEEIDQPYETKLVEFGVTTRSPEFLKINPMGKVPALTHGAAVVTETVAICAYLADAFPAAKLAPEPGDHAARAAYFRWLFFAAGPLEAAVTDAFLGVTIPEDRQGTVGYGDLNRTVDAIESAVRGKSFVAGDRFSTADLIVTAYLDFYRQMKLLPERSSFAGYIAQHKQRPAAVRADKIDNDLIAAAQAGG